MNIEKISKHLIEEVRDCLIKIYGYTTRKEIPAQSIQSQVDIANKIITMLIEDE